MKKAPTAKKIKKQIHHTRTRRRRGLWNGYISFGLVNVPIYLESATEEKKIHFNLIDKQNHSPIGYKHVNKLSGQEISKSDIVKGYEYEKGRFVLINENDFKKINPRASSTIEIEDFVDLKEIDPMLFERPYFALPQKGGEKGYVLLREVFKRTQKAAIAKVVLHTVQHLVCLMARDEYLVLEILRFADEVLETSEADFLDKSIKKIHISEREISIAEQLVKGMSSNWNPEKYHDTYREDLMKLIHSKIKYGKTEHIEKVKIPSEIESTSNIVDLTALLKKSLESRSKKRSIAHGT